MKMYIAIGLFEEDVEIYAEPDGPFKMDSPYLQSATIVFAENTEDATRLAEESLGHAPTVIKQVGRFYVDLSRQQLHGNSDVTQAIGLMDCNDTDEGVLVSFTGSENGFGAGIDPATGKVTRFGEDQLRRIADFNNESRLRSKTKEAS
jgi:hypothetical protein